MFETLKNIFKPIEKFTYFGGAKQTRIVSDWLSQSASIDRKLYADLNTLRNRARTLVHENPLMARSVFLFKCNVIGSTGIRLQSKITDPKGTPDDYANNSIEAKWYKWCESCGIRGESWIESLLLDATSYGVDGEVFVRMINSPEGFKIETIDSARIDVSLNKKKTGTQNEIRMGIERDQWGRMTAVWIIVDSDIDYRLPWENLKGYYTRIPASEILHLFIPMEPGQTRGYPPIAPVMNSLHQLNGLNEAQLVSARAGAAQMAFLKNEGDAKWTGKDANNQPEMRIEPLSMQVLPSGWSLDPFKPEIPDSYEVFSKCIMQMIAVGIGLSVPALTGDLREVNFSSIRAGNVQDQEYFKVIQKLFVDKLVNPIFTAWLKYSLMDGTLSPLPFSKLEKFNNPSWSCKRWDYVNPQQEASANETELKLKVKSRTQIIEEKGGDIEEVYAQIQREEMLAKKMGIVLEAPKEKANGNGTTETKRKDDSED
jgi:lambda family phage portal protein